MRETLEIFAHRIIQKKREKHQMNINTGIVLIIA